MLRKIYVLCVLMVLSLGGCSKTQNPPSPPQNPSNPPQNPPSPSQNPSIKPLRGDKVKNIYKADAKVDTSDQWLLDLGIHPNGGKAVVVNASNEGTTFGGSGLNGALQGYAKNKGQEAWKELQSRDGKNFTAKEGGVPAGEYVISTIGFGKIYHAVGPRALQTLLLPEAKKKAQDLYYDMLTKANQDGFEVIVLPAISTDAFAGGGPEFSREDFIDAVYQGMAAGITQFTQKIPNHLKIILNKWGEKYVAKYF
ncbi:MAG: macro domain-containing protein [Cytophagales bacterium]|nr:macro domain-containing protein [Cytophagales bacterium]